MSTAASGSTVSSPDSSSKPTTTHHYEVQHTTLRQNLQGLANSVRKPVHKAGAFVKHDFEMARDYVLTTTTMTMTTTHKRGKQKNRIDKTNGASPILGSQSETVKDDRNRFGWRIQKGWDRFTHDMNATGRKMKEKLSRPIPRQAHKVVGARHLAKIARSDHVKYIPIPRWHRTRTKAKPTVLIREDDGVTQLCAVTSLPPDPVMDRFMSVVLTKRVKGITVPQLYEQCWRTPDFYHQWLVRDAKKRIKVGEWETGRFSYPTAKTLRDDQVYSMKRTVTYSYARDPSTLGYSLGKPQVECTQTMYYRNIGDRRSILAIRMEMVGEVCSDSFLVHIRGVITKAADAPPSRNDALNEGSNRDAVGAASAADPSETLQNPGLLVDFGVHAEFVKSTILAKQIRGIVEDATRGSVMTLFDLILEACHASETERTEALHPVDGDEEEAENDPATTCCPLFGC